MAYESDIINVAVVNFKVAPGEKEVNLRRMMDMSRAAARRGADLILFPEMALMGYGMFIDESISQEEKIRVTETVNGPSTKALEHVAKEEGIYIIFGMSEKLAEEDTDIYNSAVVLGPEGLIGSYQKIHPYGCVGLHLVPGAAVFRVTQDGDNGNQILCRVLVLFGVCVHRPLSPAKAIRLILHKLRDLSSVGSLQLCAAVVAEQCVAVHLRLADRADLGLTA